MRQLIVEDILNDIEFELAQGLVLKEDLGQGVQAVRAFQNKIRLEVLDESRRPPNLRTVVARLFQINDMLITLCQEFVAMGLSLRQSHQQIAALPAAPVPSLEPALSSHDLNVAADVDSALPATSWAPPANVLNAMRTETLQVNLEPRPTSGFPIIGGLVYRFKTLLHNLSLFYTQQLAQKQVEVNRVYGEWILQLLQLSQDQQRQIEDLKTRLAALSPPEEG